MTSANAQAEDGIPVGYRYSPKLPASIASIDAAKKDLAALMQGRKGGVWAYYNSSDTLKTIDIDPVGPNARDARSAQDRNYEWELLLRK